MENRGGTTTNGAGAMIFTTNSVNVTANGTAQPNTNYLNVGESSGTLAITYNFYTAPDEMTIYYGTNTNPANVIYDTGVVSNPTRIRPAEPHKHNSRYLHAELRPNQWNRFNLFNNRHGSIPFDKPLRRLDLHGRRRLHQLCVSDLHRGHEPDHDAHQIRRAAVHEYCCDNGNYKWEYRCGDGMVSRFEGGGTTMPASAVSGLNLFCGGLVFSRRPQCDYRLLIMVTGQSANIISGLTRLVEGVNLVTCAPQCVE